MHTSSCLLSPTIGSSITSQRTAFMIEMQVDLYYHNIICTPVHQVVLIHLAELCTTCFKTQLVFQFCLLFDYTEILLNPTISRVSRKLRPRKLRPQTRKTQTFGCLKLRPRKNSDPKNSDLWMSRKLRPRKNSDPKNKTYLHRVNAASRLVYCSLIQWHYHDLPRKEKQFVVS